ncbi:MAG: hypothetical protein PXY39_09540 [archaeon]|nr:hypothetical protein [archaeon]
MRKEDDEREEKQQLKAKHLNKNEFLSRLDAELKEDYEVISDVHDRVENAKQELAKEKKRETLRNPFFSITSFIENLEKNQDDYELFSEGSSNLSIKLVDPAPSLKILKEPEILVMMSGTMPSGDYIEKVWGIEGCKEISVQIKYAEEYYSVFSKENLRFELIHDKEMTASWGNRKFVGEKLWQGYGKIINRAFEKESLLSVLVCCPSYFVASRISNYIQAPNLWKIGAPPSKK